MGILGQSLILVLVAATSRMSDEHLSQVPGETFVLLHPFCCADGFSAVHLFKDASVEAVEVLFRNSGGAQSTTIRCSDDNLYAVKMNRNPQGSRLLINEALGSLLLEGLGLTTPIPRRVWVGQRMIESSPLLLFETRTGSSLPEVGFHFGSQIIPYSQSSDEAKPTSLALNRAEVTGIRLFDLWANHMDRRQYLYQYDFMRSQSTISFVDNGHLFGGPEWHDHINSRWSFAHLKSLHLDDPALTLWVKRFRNVLPALLETVAEVVDSIWPISNMAELIRCFQNRLTELESIVTSLLLP